MVIQAATLGWAMMAALFCLIELKTPGLFYFLSFALGSIGAGISAFNGWLPQDQMVLFFGLSSVAFFFLRVCVGVMHKTVKNHKTNTEALLGKHGVVTRLISTQKVGQVRVGGELWSAQSLHGQLEAGASVVVERVEGVRLIVKNV